jgi:hypothetical protein
MSPQRTKLKKVTLLEGEGIEQFLKVVHDKEYSMMKVLVYFFRVIGYLFDKMTKTWQE